MTLTIIVNGCIPRAQDPYSEFQRIFSKFSTAERVTGAEPDSEDEEDGAAARDGEGDGSTVKVITLLTLNLEPNALSL